MKQPLILIILFFLSDFSHAQTNTFPESGNVGIGTTTPQAKLHVNGLQMLNGDLMFASDQTAFFIKGPANGGAIRIRSNGPSAADRNVQFGNIDNNGTWNSFMTVAQNGYVGIGTTTPAYTLDVTNNLRIGAQGGSDYTLIGGGSGVGSEIRMFYADGRENNYLAGNNNCWFAAAIGKVGIGTTSPSYKLDVNGETRILKTVITNSNSPFDNSSVIFTEEGKHNMFGVDGSWLTKYFGMKTNGDFITMGGNFGIGVKTPTEKLSVNGKIRAQEIKVETANWPDYVFAKDYQLPTLLETEKHIKEKGHLPGIPTAAEVKANGIDLGDMNAKLLQKIEELTLHLIQQSKLLEIQSKRMDIQQQEINNLKQNKK